MRGVLFYSLSSFFVNVQQQESLPLDNVFKIRNIVLICAHIIVASIPSYTTIHKLVHFPKLDREEDRWSFVDITVRIFVVFGFYVHNTLLQIVVLLLSSV